MTEGADGSRSQAERGPDPTPGVGSAVAGGSRSVAAAGDLGIALSGDGSQVVVHGDVLVGERSRGWRSGYLLEVREMRAPRFEGRADELAAMAAFATAPEGEAGGYWRWLAPAWTGKTALMAEFVLNPPDGADVLAFFITARMAGRADRTAFLDALGGQLRDYLREGDVECATQGAFLDGLERAAAQARAAGRRIVLVVDGLDEDTGVRTGSSGHSIAALLPRTPPPGLRIIVAGRPNPPVPSDVPRSHPLRDPGIDHPLATSPAARAMREDAERSLEGMLDAGGLGRELVALTAAAGGGLSAADLAELAGVSRRRVELALGGVIGRSFQRRPAQWATDADGRPLSLYSFAHQELLDGARDILGPAALAEQRARVHAYVAGAREAGWPPETSEYALTGYPQLLRETRDTGRLEALALDQARHERLWQTTGTDSQALTEINDAMELHRAVEAPDVAACVRLAHRREEVWEKAASVPADVILMWAEAGQVRRALTATGHRRSAIELPYLLGGIALQASSDADAVAQIGATAQAIGEPSIRTATLSRIVKALAARGQFEVAGKLCQRATEALRGVAGTQERVGAMIDVAQALSAVGHGDAAGRLLDQTLKLSSDCDDPGRRDWAMVLLASGLATWGRRAQDARLTQLAVTVAESTANALCQVLALARVATQLGLAGQYDDANRLIKQASGLVRSFTSQQQHDVVTGALAGALVSAGRHEDALVAAYAVPDPKQRSLPLLLITRALIKAGRCADAIRFTHTITGARHRAAALAAVARASAAAGERQRATELAQQALDIARAPSDTYHHASALASVAAQRVPPGHHIRADPLACQACDIVLGQQQVDVLTAAATAWLVIGWKERAAGLMQRATAHSHAISTDPQRGMALTSVVEVLAKAGQYEKAADIARTITFPDWQARALARVAEALSLAGRPEEATPLFRRAIELTNAEGEDTQGLLRAFVAQALASSGLFEEAEALARAIDHPHEQRLALAVVARRMAVHGRRADAAELIQQALDTLSDASGSDFDAAAAAAIVAALVANDQPEDALPLVRSITGHPFDQGQALAAVAAAYGHSVRGSALLAEALAVGAPLWTVAEIAEVTPAALESLADYLQADIEADLTQPGDPTQPPPTTPLTQPESPDKGTPQAE
ncbi:hypothetical protein H8N00_28290 [Streptomyces sp. AC563]|uniref:hypothetical protein n=1 Tax=Streptomyces buecherae TaxID=2763006 RepID=UPI00164ECC8E|nr:hypothetical protein [Streptomyces buecherae]MBC3992702.1 hypothetical protein [Streptomyces buecherae]